MEQKDGSKKRYIVQAIIWVVLLIASLITLPNINQLVREKRTNQAAKRLDQSGS